MKLDPSKRQIQWLIIVLVFALAFFIRYHAVMEAFGSDSGDVDEGIYVNRAEFYASSILEGDLKAIMQDEVNNEHPLLAKLLFAISIILFGENSMVGMNNLMAARLVSIALAALVAALLYKEFGIVPSLLWTFSSWSIKYGMEAYFESPVSAFSLIALIYLKRYHQASSDQESTDKYLVLSAIFSAAAFASKYTGFLAGLLVFLGISWISRSSSIQDIIGWKSIIQSLRDQLRWIAVFLLSFFIFNPRALNIPRFVDSLFFHVEYSQTDYVQNTNPFAQFDWIFMGKNPVAWHEEFPVPYIDDFLILLSFLGAGMILYHLLARPSASKLESKYVIMFFFYLANLAFLMIWSTKWPQYLALFIIPSSICVSYLFVTLAEPLRGIAKLDLTRKSIKTKLLAFPLSLTFLLVIMLSGLLIISLLSSPAPEDPGSGNGDTPDIPDLPDMNYTVDWTLIEHDLASNTADQINNTYIWKDASSDDTGDGDYTYPTNDVFVNQNAADIDEVQIRFEEHYLLVSIKMAWLYDIGWGSEINQDLAAIYFGLDWSENDGIIGIEDAESTFSKDYDLVVSAIREIWSYQIIDGSLHEHKLETYQANAATGWIQIPLDLISYGIPTGPLDVFVAAGLEEFSTTREIEESPEEWFGGGGSSSPDESDFYDLAFVDQSDQENSISTGIIDGVEIFSDYLFQLTASNTPSVLKPEVSRPVFFIQYIGENIK